MTNTLWARVFWVAVEEAEVVSEEDAVVCDSCRWAAGEGGANNRMTS